MLRKFTFPLLFICNHWALIAQCPVANFSLAENTFCIGEQISPTNTSTNSTEIYWTFCEDQLTNTPNETEILNTSSAFVAIYDSDFVDDNRAIAIRNNGVPYILTLNDSLTVLESLSALTDAGVYSSLPRDIETIQIEDDIIAIFSNSTGSNITRAYWEGGDLTQDPVYDLIDDMAPIASTNGLELILYDNSYYALVGKNSTNELNILDFSTDLMSTPTVTTISISDIDGIQGISLQKECDTWVGLITSQEDNRLFKLTWDGGLLATPDIEEIIIASTSWIAPVKIKIAIDQGNIYAFVQLINGDIFRLSFGDSFANTPTESIIPALSPNCYSINIKQNIANQWRLFSIDYGANTGLYTASFENDCDESIFTSTDNSPHFSFEEPGDYDLKLIATSSNGNTDQITKTVTITSDIAPSISISPLDNECLGQINNFSTVDDGEITYEWSFDGGATIGSTDPTPAHTYSQTGDSLVILTVNDGTCSNFIQDTVSIYPVPTPVIFSTEPYCTNTELTFTNDSDESNHQGATITYTWDYGDGTEEESTDGNHTYSAADNYEVTLNMAIPGCNTDAVQNIEVIAGPDINFSILNDCFEETMQFSNLTTGDNLINPSWDFGDGSGSSTLSDPSYIYNKAGDFDVVLTMENSEGCVSALTETIRVNGLPEIAFSHNPGCTDQLISFEDESMPGDALNNVNSWQWDFNSLGNSSDENPDFTFDETGNYLVTLTVGNTGNCFNSATQTVTVQPAPVADFNIDLGCIDASTGFEDLSETVAENQIASWYWEINGEEYYTQDVEELFTEAGDYTAKLTITPSNLCIDTLTKSFTIYQLPNVGFEVTNNCDNELTIFTDTTVTDGSDILARVWSFDDQGTGSGAQSVHHFNEEGVYDINLEVMDENGCKNELEKEMEVYASPAAVFSASTDIGDVPLLVDFFNETQGVISSLWNFGDAESSTSSDTNPQFTYTELGVYNAELIAANENCSDSAYLEIVVATPWFDLELNKIETREVNGMNQIWLTVENQGVINQDGFDIRVDIENQNSIFETYTEELRRGETITFALNFSVPVSGNNINFLCATLIDKITEVEDSDIENNQGCISFTQEVNIEPPYPNPIPSTSDIITLQSILPTKSPVDIYITDATGAVTFDQSFANVDAGLNTFNISVAGYRAGIYFIKVKYAGVTASYKFVRM